MSHNWSVGSQTCHDSVRQNCLRELKEEAVVMLKWIVMDENSADLFTKTRAGPLLHVATYCGVDEYGGDNDPQNTQREGVRGSGPKEQEVLKGQAQRAKSN